MKQRQPGVKIAQKMNLGFIEFFKYLTTISTGAIVVGFGLLDKPRYLARPSARKHKDYYDQLATGSLQLAGENRIAICSAEPSEIAANPAAHYYFLDGVGRCLPYMILLKEQKLKHTPIEAFLAEPRPCSHAV